MKELVKNTVILLVIALTAGFLLGFFNDFTKESIEQRNEEAKIESLTNVIGEEYTVVLDESIDLDQASSNENIKVDEAYQVVNDNGEFCGMVMLITTSEGYSDDITISLGILDSGSSTKNAVISGIDFLSINETPGLGMNAKDAEFKDQFEGKAAEEIIATKNAYLDSHIDTISGATITSDAVTGAVNAGISFYNFYVGEEDMQ